MKKRVIFLLAMGLFFPGISGAYNINYANLESIAGNDVLLKYRTTSGYTFALCTLEGKCGELLYGENMDSNAPSIFPNILNKTNYAKSVDGKFAVVDFAQLNGETYRALYSIDGGNSSFKTLLPHTAPAVRTSVSYANDAVIFIGNGGQITRYDINSRKLASVNTGRDSFPFSSTSEHGNFFASYNYTAEAQDIWKIGGEKVATVPAKKPSYTVFSNSENYIAYIDEVDGFNKLFVGELSDSTKSKDVSAGKYTVAEYEFVGDVLYYIANTEKDPYEWNLYSYDPKTGEREVVDSNVAYDDSYGNLRKTHTTLFYEKVDGKNKNVIALKPGSDNRTVLSAVAKSAASSEISRTVVDLDGISGVLLAPENANRSTSLPLIVWLHGGPMRQTSTSFHPFYGYAVYDDLLEKMATEAYVLKLDYTGSWGHGNDFREALVGNIGNLDVQDVFNSISEIKGEKSIDEVYLIGNSYGGYLALRALAEDSDEIDAVVSIAGVTDWESLISRIPSSPFSASFYGAPSIANAGLYAQASVASRLNNVDDQEMLIVYGSDDASVPTWQSTEFTATAQTLGKNINLIRYEGEGHTILKKNNLVDLCENTTAVFSLSSSICRE